MKKFWRQLLRPRLPASRINNEALQMALGVDREHHVLRGVTELVERMQLAALQTIGDEAETTEARLAAGVRFDTGRMLLEAIEQWRGSKIDGNAQGD
jgi:hypothetical protein